MPFNNQNAGIEQALAQIGQQQRSANPYSPFKGQVPAQQLNQIGQQQQPQMPMNVPQMQPTAMAQQQVPQQAQLPQIGQPLGRMDRTQRMEELRKRLRNPQFLAMLRQRRGLGL
jgi:hypothetical protein